MIKAEKEGLVDIYHSAAECLGTVGLWLFYTCMFS